MGNSTRVSGFTQRGSAAISVSQRTRDRTRNLARECGNRITRLILPLPDRAAPAWGNSTSCNRMQKEKRDR